VAESLAVTLHASGEETTADNGSSVDLEYDGVGLRRVAELSVLVSAITDEATLYIETSEDGSFWEVVHTIEVDTPSRQVVFTGPLQRYLRVRWVVETSATFSVSGTAHQCYGALADLYLFGLPSNTFSGVATATQWQHLLSATGEVRSYLGNRASTIISVGFEAKNAACQIAALNLLTNQVGIAPDPRAVELIVTAAVASREWLKQVGLGRANSGAVFVDTTPSVTEGGGYGDSDASRGWGDLAP